MKITIISGSNRIGRQSHKIAKYLETIANGKPEISEVSVLDINEYNFPVMEERHGRLENPPSRLEEFHQVLDSCDGLIIVTPEYNGGMSGALKNTLDYFRHEYTNKPMTAVTVSGGNMGGVNALHQLWYWMLHVGGIVSPTKLLVSNVAKAFNETGEVIDERLIRNADKTIDALLWLMKKINS